MTTMKPRLLKQSKILAETAPKIKLLLHQTNNFKIIPDALRDKIQQAQVQAQGQRQAQGHVSPPPPPSRTSQKASILVPIIHVTPSSSSTAIATTPSILFTTRSSQLTHHANEISFPGGHVDEEDDNCVIRAALRETREELTRHDDDGNGHGNGHGHDDGNSNDDGDGNDSLDVYDFDQGIEVLGTTESIPSMKNIPVTPVVAYFKEEFTAERIQSLFPGNESEVSRVFTVPIEELVRIEGEEPLKRLGAGVNGPVYHCVHGKIWGLTAVVLKPILDRILKPVFLTPD